MDDPMADGVDALHRGHGRLQVRILETTRRRFELVVDDLLPIRVNQAHLERARARVDDEYSHRLTRPRGQGGRVYPGRNIALLVSCVAWSNHFDNHIPGKVSSPSAQPAGDERKPRRFSLISNTAKSSHECRVDRRRRRGCTAGGASARPPSAAGYGRPASATRGPDRSRP